MRLFQHPSWGSWLCALSLLAWLSACGTHGPHPERVRDTYNDYEGTIEEPDAASLTANITKVAVEQEGLPPFSVATRKEHLNHFPCQQCHQDQMPEPAKQAAHWDVVLKHADAATMSCTTCHDAENKMMTLKTLQGHQVRYDRSYDLCGQCHFQQRADWAGGSHGKREAAWAGQRVIRNCTGCHDPHQPTFPTRWPAMAPGPINTTPEH